MTANLNKKILIASELHASAMGLFFQELGFELTDTYVEGEHYAFAVDSVCPEVLTIARVQFAKTIDPRVAQNIRGHIAPGFFKNELGKNLLRSHFNEAQELNLVERYSSNLKSIYNIKLQDYLNLGFFVDSIVVEAYRGKFDITALRSYLNVALNFAFKKIEFNVDVNPIE
ncbi:MAG: hypothetical protein K2Q18_03655, partial [Bdellovibrionales bacterium]|nr:hypothetical protein [Bdellovibrionales bacterium]